MLWGERNTKGRRTREIGPKMHRILSLREDARAQARASSLYRLRLGNGDDLSGVGQSAAEGEEQSLIARGQRLIGGHQLGQRQRHRGGRGIAGVDHVGGHAGVGCADLLRQGLDDAQISLVQDDRVQLFWLHSRTVDDLRCDLRQLGDGPAVNALPVLRELHVIVRLDAYRIGQRRNRPPNHRGNFCGLGGGDDERPGAVRGQHAGAAVGEVGEIGEHLGADNQCLGGTAGGDRTLSHAYRMGEPGAGGIQVHGGRPLIHAEAQGHAGGHMRGAIRRGAGGDDDQVDVFGVDVRGVVQGHLCGLDRHRINGLDAGAPAALLNPYAAGNPLVAGLDQRFQLGVGHDALRLEMAKGYDFAAGHEFNSLGNEHSCSQG